MTKTFLGILLSGLLATAAISPHAAYAQATKLGDQVTAQDKSAKPAATTAAQPAADKSAKSATSEEKAKRPRTAYQDKLKECGAKWKDEKKATGAKGRDAWNAFRKKCMG